MHERNPLSKSGALTELFAASPPETLVPIESQPVFAAFAAEVCRQIAIAPGQNLVVFVDPGTAKTVPDFASIQAVAAHIAHVNPNDHREAQDENSAPQYVLALLSTTASVAMLGLVTESNGRFTGGWTAERETVLRLACELGQMIPETYPELPSSQVDAILHWTPQVTRLMTTFTRIVSSYQRTETVGRDDLLSVLDILKAISSRRRSHDVLYIFVEQIARTIRVDRCSVVRVWGTDDHGSVVASHDDAGIRDLEIELEKYPELRRSMELFEKVVVEDAHTDPLTRECAGLQGTEIKGILVVPIVLLDANVGSLFLRAVRKDMPFTAREVGFCEIVAEAASNALERAHLLERLQNANERLERLAVTDELTGLHNHRYFRERFAEEFDRARRYGLPLSCIIFDIDNFKQINDEYGHLQGDEILREIAARTGRTTRRSDVLARYGGEEFVIIMPQTGAAGAAAQAERIRECVAKPGYPGMETGALVTVSLGVAELEHREMLDGESLIRAADTAMYEAKRSGKNCVVVADSTEN